jgi:hypothetical protein
MWMGGVEHYLGEGDVPEVLERQFGDEAGASGQVDGEPAWSMLGVSD